MKRKYFVFAGFIALALVFVFIKYYYDQEYNKNSCRLKLMNIGWSMQGYVAGHRGSFPPAALPNEGLPFERRLSWLVDIFDIFYGNVKLIINKGESWDSQSNV